MSLDRAGLTKMLPLVGSQEMTFKEKVRQVLNKEEKLGLRQALVNYRRTGWEHVWRIFCWFFWKCCIVLSGTSVVFATKLLSSWTQIQREVYGISWRHAWVPRTVITSCDTMTSLRRENSFTNVMPLQSMPAPISKICHRITSVFQSFT